MSVRASTVPSAAALLGRHVLGRAEQLAGMRARPRLGVLQQLRDPEIEHLDECERRGPRGPAGIGDPHQVRRLHVAVDDAVPVRGAQAIGDLRRDRARLRPGQGAFPLEGAGQRLAREVLHRDVRPLPVRVNAAVEDLDDGGMMNEGGGARLVEEPPQDLGVGGEIGGQDLDRRAPRDPLVLTEEDRAHRAASQVTNDPVIAERLANHGAQLPRQKWVTGVCRQET